MEIMTVRIDKPEDTNFIFGQTHFIKSVEDIHEALVSSVPGIRFGLAFCEASGKCLVRCSGTDAGLIELARKNATAIGAGHSFIIFSRGRFLSGECSECNQDGPGGVWHFLRYRQSHGGDPGGDGTGSWSDGRSGRIVSKRCGGREARLPGARTCCVKSVINFENR